MVPPKKADPEKDAAAGGKGDFAASDEPKKSAEALLGEALRDARVKFLADMKLPEGEDGAEARGAYEALGAGLRAEWPGHLPVLREALKRAEAAPAETRGAEANQARKPPLGREGRPCILLGARNTFWCPPSRVVEGQEG